MFFVGFSFIKMTQIKFFQSVFSTQFSEAEKFSMLGKGDKFVLLSQKNFP